MNKHQLQKTTLFGWHTHTPNTELFSSATGWHKCVTDINVCWEEEILRKWDDILLKWQNHLPSSYMPVQRENDWRWRKTPLWFHPHTFSVVSIQLCKVSATSICIYASRYANTSFSFNLFILLLFSLSFFKIRHFFILNNHCLAGPVHLHALTF